MAKDLVRTRNYITRFIEMKTHLNAVSLKIQTIKSHQAMAEAMKGVTKALTSMNKKISLPGMQKIMAEFMKENEKFEVTQETIGDTIDDAMAEDGSAEQEDMIVNQVLDELGIGAAGEVPDAPSQATASAAPAAAEEASGKLFCPSSC
jgi:charged multivesicular body protein 2A